MVHLKEPLLLIGKQAHVVTAVGFISRYLNGPFTICQMSYNHT